jgi:predicted  nucleic acid-binding Zn-ribbon protein
VKIEATANEIRALLEFAEADKESDPLPPDTRRQGREAAARRLPERLLERYEALLGTGRTPVVVAIERGACSGCHVRLPTMVEYMARRSSAVHVCPHCRRLLYVPDLVRDAKADGAKSRRPAAPPTVGSSSSVLPRPVEPKR